jgi:VIT1/CCC1 family predicted Fe2+/Mn2+ transporter
VTAHPIQAAVVSALTFAAGAVVPLIVALLSPPVQTTLVVAVSTLKLPGNRRRNQRPL